MAARWKAWVLNGLLAAVALVTGLLLTEVCVRLLAPQPTGLSHQDRYGLARHWPSMKRYLPQFGVTAAFNSAGMRDREHALEKAPGVFRILVLGDSFMEALQVPFEESFPHLLEQSLSESSGRKIEVLNAGVSGWGTDDELRYLTWYGLEWKPDLVLVAMTLHNDISDNLREDWHTLVNGALVEQPRERMSFLAYKVVELKAYLASRLQIYQLWRKVRHGNAMRQTGRELNSHIVELCREPTTEEIGRGVSLTGLLLERIQSITRTQGGQVALMLLPLRVQLSDSIFSGFVQSAGATLPQMPLDKPQRLLGEISTRLGIPKVDLLPDFRRWTAEGGESLYLEEDGHWNAAGHRRAATVAAAGLFEAGVIR